jgi:hypothetical protein
VEMLKVFEVRVMQFPVDKIIRFVVTLCSYNAYNMALRSRHEMHIQFAPGPVHSVRTRVT